MTSILRAADQPVLRVAAEHGLEPLEVIENPYTGMRPGEVSNTFLMRKRDSA